MCVVEPAGPHAGSSRARRCSELVRCEVCGTTVVERDGAGSRACGVVRPARWCASTATDSLPCRPAGVPRARRPRGPAPDATVAKVDVATEGCPTPACSSAPRRCCTASRGTGRCGLVAFLELDQELLAPRTGRGAGAVAARAGGAAARAAGRRGGAARPDPAARARGACVAARDGDPARLAAAERARRRALGYPPFGGWPSSAATRRRSAAACDASRAPSAGHRARTGDDGGARWSAPRRSTALRRARARPTSTAAHALGRLRVDVDPAGVLTRVCSGGRRSGNAGARWPCIVPVAPLRRPRAAAARARRRRDRRRPRPARARHVRDDVRAPGVGLAAPQVGVRKRLFTYDSRRRSRRGHQPRDRRDAPARVSTTRAASRCPGCTFEIVRPSSSPCAASTSTATRSCSRATSCWAA